MHLLLKRTRVEERALVNAPFVFSVCSLLAKPAYSGHAAFVIGLGHSLAAAAQLRSVQTQPPMDSFGQTGPKIIQF